MTSENSSVSFTSPNELLTSLGHIQQIISPVLATTGSGRTALGETWTFKTSSFSSTTTAINCGSSEHPTLRSLKIHKKILLIIIKIHPIYLYHLCYLQYFIETRKGNYFGLPPEVEGPSAIKTNHVSTSAFLQRTINHRVLMTATHIYLTRTTNSISYILLSIYEKSRNIWNESRKMNPQKSDCKSTDRNMKNRYFHNRNWQWSKKWQQTCSNPEYTLVPAHFHHTISPFLAEIDWGKNPFSFSLTSWCFSAGWETKQQNLCFSLASSSIDEVNVSVRTIILFIKLCMIYYELVIIFRCSLVISWSYWCMSLKTFSQLTESEVAKSCWVHPNGF